MRLTPNLLAALAFTGILGVSSRVAAQTVPTTSTVQNLTAVADLDRVSGAVSIPTPSRTLTALRSELLRDGEHADGYAPGRSSEATVRFTALSELAEAAPKQSEGSRDDLEAAPPEGDPEPGDEADAEAESGDSDLLPSSDLLEDAEDGSDSLEPEVTPEDAPEFDFPDGPLDGEAEPDTMPEPVAPQPEPPATEDDGQAEEQPQEEPRVLVAEVAVEPVDGVLDEDLRQRVYAAVDTVPGRTTTRTQLQRDINNVFATGFFSNVRAVPEDTPLGVRVTFLVQPNPVLRSVRVTGNEVLPEEVVDEIFAPQYGEIINLIDFQDGIVELNEWYQDNGYVLAQVIAAPRVGEDGIVTLEVAEGVVEDIEVQFVNSEGRTEDDEGNPIRGRTRDFIITREFETEPGDVFNQAQIEQDLQEVFGLGIFEDVRLSLEPGTEDPRKVDVIVNVTEGNTGSVAAGLGFNFTGDIFGTVSYRQDNFGGNNQKFSAETQLSTRDLLFDISFTDPWIAGDPYMTSYTTNLFARRSINLNFDGGPNPIDLANGDRVRIRRIGGGVSFSRPLGGGWTASIGTEVQNVSARNAGGGLEAVDDVGNPLTFNSTGIDDLWTVPVSAVWDRRNSNFNPTSGSILRLTSEQSIPIGRGSIFFNRLRASYSQYIPVSFLNFSDGPQAIAMNIQGGTVVGDLPPYEAFSLGGTNSVRGYDEGDVGSGRSYVQATVEYRFPLFSFIGGALFVDAATDLGSGFSVPGDPGPDRGKPGGGFGYGAGLRVQTPLGPIRIDYGINDQGDGRLHFGIGERF
ncbi:hypothetical protein C7271_03860 [filamentous cyanobacterium CCP5]|nr:hypothetical protein C7271_03860 [filamentous cyanobacterium CCP5]